jgi:hypothetical protein
VVGEEEAGMEWGADGYSYATPPIQCFAPCGGNGGGLGRTHPVQRPCSPPMGQQCSDIYGLWPLVQASMLLEWILHSVTRAESSALAGATCLTSMACGYVHPAQQVPLGLVNGWNHSLLETGPYQYLGAQSCSHTGREPRPATAGLL